MSHTFWVGALTTRVLNKIASHILKLKKWVMLTFLKEEGKCLLLSAQYSRLWITNWIGTPSWSSDSYCVTFRYVSLIWDSPHLHGNIHQGVVCYTLVHECMHVQIRTWIKKVLHCIKQVQVLQFICVLSWKENETFWKLPAKKKEDFLTTSIMFMAGLSSC